MFVSWAAKVDFCFALGSVGGMAELIGFWKVEI
jgi:hypothetical protein